MHGQHRGEVLEHENFITPKSSTNRKPIIRWTEDPGADRLSPDVNIKQLAKATYKDTIDAERSQ